MLDLMNLQLPRIVEEGEEMKPTEPEEPGKQFLSLDRIDYIVIDEADRMLDLGFKEQLNLMFNSLSTEREYQIVCCSATNTEKVVTRRRHDGQIQGVVEKWCPNRYDIEMPNNSIVVSTRGARG